MSDIIPSSIESCSDITHRYELAPRKTSVYDQARRILTVEPPTTTTQDARVWQAFAKYSRNVGEKTLTRQSACSLSLGQFCISWILEQFSFIFPPSSIPALHASRILAPTFASCVCAGPRKSQTDGIPRSRDPSRLIRLLAPCRHLRWIEDRTFAYRFRALLQRRVAAATKAVRKLTSRGSTLFSPSSSDVYLRRARRKHGASNGCTAYTRQ